ncbi:MAG: ABC transporter permease [Candidatus Micrarchaeota archaeon]
MKLEDSVEIALTNIAHQKLRSWLTILGIVIGVAAIITLISISVGLEQNVKAQTSAFGANQIIVSAGSQKAGRMMGFGPAGGGPPSGTAFGQDSGGAEITFKEAETLRSIPGISVLDAQLEGRSEVAFRTRNSSLSVIGTEPDSLPEIVNVGLEEGRFLSAGDKYSAVIGNNVAHGIFLEEENMLNSQVDINGVAFKVVGILEESGGIQGSDSSLYIPIDTAKELFGEDEAVSRLVILSKENHDAEEVADDIGEELKELHGLSEDEDADFQITTAASVQSAVSSITDTLALFLGGIASISLIVGGIGVLNTMFMSVLEQTKTIGVFKALGAKDRDIIGLFLIEAATLGLIGGLAGIGLSFFSSIVLSMAGLPTVITFELVGAGLLFSVVVGIVAGIIPARNAAGISPIESLRYE